MIYYVRGKLVSKTPARVIIETNGVGYALDVSIETSRALGHEGEDAMLFTYLMVREEEVMLYGFAAEEEREAFLMLLAVPGIGPKVALRILSGMSISELYSAILAEDVSFFTAIPGVGKKTGERLIIELKQRVEKLDVSPLREKSDSREMFVSAVEALSVLGYKRKDAVSAVGRIMKEGGPATIEEIIKEALKKG